MLCASMTLSSAVTGSLMSSRLQFVGRTPCRSRSQRLHLLAVSQARADSPVPKLEPSAEAGTLASQVNSAFTAGKSKRKARVPKAVDGASDVTVDEAGPPAKQAAKTPRAPTARRKSPATKAAAGGTAKTKAAAGSSKRKPRATKAAATAVAEAPAEQAAAGSEAQPKAAAETSSGTGDELISRQRDARKFITPWLTAKRQAAGREVGTADTLRYLREQDAGLLPDQQERALKRLLSQGWQDAAARIADDSEEDTGESEEGSSGLEDTVAAPTASATSKEAAPAEDSSQGKFTPTETLEDGSMMFSTEALSTMSFEEILTP